jgi:hypothetical protein
MKLNFKRIVTVLTSTVLLSSTLAFAAAANYPSPFVKNGNANVAIVYGSTAALTDVAAVVDITGNLQAKLDQQTGTTGSSTSGASSSGGDSVNLATSSQNLFYTSSLNAARSIITKSTMPNLLADGTFTDSAGNTYTYSQSITVGNMSIKYGTAGNNVQDPILYLDNSGTAGGGGAVGPLYTYTLNLNKPLEVNNSNVIGNNINILGNSYTIGANSIATGTSSDILYLYGAGQQIQVNDGSSSNVTVGGASHTVSVTGTTQSGSTNQAYISVDGSTPQVINQGTALNINGLQIYAKTVFYSGKTGTTNYAVINVGTNVLQLAYGSTAATGTNANSITGTRVGIASSGGKLSSLTVNITANDSNKNFIPVGGSFVDPVFGTLKVQYADTVPGLNDTSNNDPLTVTTDGSRNVLLQANPWNIGTNTQPSIYFLHDQRSDTTVGSPFGSNNLRLALM